MFELKDRKRSKMAGQTWLVLSLGICLCEFPCSAQRRSPFASHGSFVRGPTIPRMNGGVQFRPGGGYRAFARPHPPYGFRAFQPMRRPIRSFQGRSEFSSRVDNDAPGSSFTRGPHRFSESNVARQFNSVFKEPSPFAEERAMVSSPPMASARAIRSTTQRTDRFVPRPPPSRIAGTTSIVPRPTFGSRSMSPLLTRPSLRSAAVGGNSNFGNIPQLVAPRPKIILSSRSFSPFLSNRFFSPRPFLFSPFFSNTFFLSQPRFFSPLFSRPFFFRQPTFFSPLFSNGFFFSLSFANPFFFQRPLLSSPFFFNSFFFQPTFFLPFFSSGFFFSLSFANPFFFQQPLFFSPLFSGPFLFQQPLFFSPFSSHGFFIRRSFHFDI
jgi:hypothetical protein